MLTDQELFSLILKNDKWRERYDLSFYKCNVVNKSSLFSSYLLEQTWWVYGPLGIVRIPTQQWASEYVTTIDNKHSMTILFSSWFWMEIFTYLNKLMYVYIWDR